MIQDPQSADDVTRSLPCAVGPEKSLLSSMLQEPAEYIGLALEEKLTGEHFYLPAHAILFGFLVELYDNEVPIELVSLVQKLLDKGLLDRVGGPAAVTDLYTYAPSSGHFRHHLEMVQSKYVARRIIQISNEAIASVYDAPDEVMATLDDTEQAIFAIRAASKSEPPLDTRRAVLAAIENFQRLINNEPSARGLPSGFEEFDRKTGGLKPGHVYVIGARPSMGKTSFLMNVAEHVALAENVPSMIFSAEMDTQSVVDRLIFSRAKFAKSQLDRGYTPNKGDLARIQRASLEIQNSPIFIDDTSSPSISYIRAKCRRMKRDHKIGFIGIDYLQLCKSTSKQAQFSREREIAEISAGLKALAKDLGLPVMVLAQLNRDQEKRGSKGKPGRPRMSDLRESGAIEQDADVIGLLYRDAYFAETDEDKEALAGRASLDLAKNRNGETGLIPLTFIAELMRFESGAPYVQTSFDNRYND